MRRRGADAAEGGGGLRARHAFLALPLLSGGVFAPVLAFPNYAEEEVMPDLAEQDVRAIFTAQLGAMVAGDLSALDAILDEDFVLTHLTGHRQPKAEWLAQMGQGQFLYHRMDERSVRIEMNGDRARLVGQTQTDSTVYGSRRPGGWRLQMTQDYALRDGRWIALNCVTSLW